MRVDQRRHGLLLGIARTNDLAAVRALGVACGDAFSCAVMEGGTVQCWGSNTEGTLGIGATDTNAHAKPVGIVKF